MGEDASRFPGQQYLQQFGAQQPPTPQQYPNQQQQYPAQPYPPQPYPPQQYPPQPQYTQYPPQQQYTQQQYSPQQYSQQQYPQQSYPQQSGYPNQQQQFAPQQAQPFGGYGQGTATGKKKALLIGINYKGSSAALRGCINDVQNIKKFLVTKHGFPDTPDTMVVLTDDQPGPKSPTRVNMTAGMQWLVAGAQPGDSLFFHYSGHGGQKKDTDGDEDDGMDETILPVDFRQAGQIVDDEMWLLMVRPLVAGVKLTCIFDSCHSGTALDLPFIYNDKGVMIESPEMRLLGMGVKKMKQKFSKGTKGALFGKLLDTGMNYMKQAQEAANPQAGGQSVEKTSNKVSPADVIMFSGCRDDQTSADANIAGVGATGAMSYAFISTLSDTQGPLSYLQILGKMRDVLNNGPKKFTQVPQLSAGHEMDLNRPFVL